VRSVRVLHQLDPRRRSVRVRVVREAPTDPSIVIQYRASIVRVSRKASGESLSRLRYCAVGLQLGSGWKGGRAFLPGTAHRRCSSLDREGRKDGRSHPGSTALSEW
jgi:hypothetical protein